MSWFRVKVDGEWKDILFASIRGGTWAVPGEAMILYTDTYPFIPVYIYDYDMEDEDDRETWNMLLQVSNLDAS